MLNRQRELTLPRAHCGSHCHQLHVCFNTPVSVAQAGAGEEGAGGQEYEVVLRVRGGEAQRAAQGAGRE